MVIGDLLLRSCMSYSQCSNRLCCYCCGCCSCCQPRRAVLVAIKFALLEQGVLFRGTSNNPFQLQLLTFILDVKFFFKFNKKYSNSEYQIPYKNPLGLNEKRKKIIRCRKWKTTFNFFVETMKEIFNGEKLFSYSKWLFQHERDTLLALLWKGKDQLPPFLQRISVAQCKGSHLGFGQNF